MADPHTTAQLKMIEQLADQVAEAIADAHGGPGYWNGDGKHFQDGYRTLAVAALAVVAPAFAARDVEIARLRREVEFEAHGENPGAGEPVSDSWHTYLDPSGVRWEHPGRSEDCQMPDCRSDQPEMATPSEWSNRLGWTVLDPDGWRRDGKPWHDPITEAEFRRRASMSTVDR